MLFLLVQSTYLKQKTKQKTREVWVVVYLALAFRQTHVLRCSVWIGYAGEIPSSYWPISTSIIFFNVNTRKQMF